MDKNKVVALLDEKDAAALMYHYAGEVRTLTAKENAAYWNEELDAETRRCIKKAAYFASLLDELDQRKQEPTASKYGVVPIAEGA